MCKVGTEGALSAEEREEDDLGVTALADADRLGFRLKAFGGAPAIAVLLRTTP